MYKFKAGKSHQYLILDKAKTQFWHCPLQYFHVNEH